MRLFSEDAVLKCEYVYRRAGADQALFGYDFHIYIQGTSGNAEVNFIGHPSVAQYTRLAAGDSTTENNGDLVRRFNTWEDVSLKVDNGTVSAIVDGNAVFTRNFNGDTSATRL